MRNKWADLIREHEEDLLHTLEETYESACGGVPGLIYCVELMSDGEIHVTQFTNNNSWSGEVNDGIATEIARIECFDPTDYEESWSFDSDLSLKEEDITKFLAWCEAEEIDTPTPDDLHEWDENIFDSWHVNYCTEYAEIYKKEFAERAYDDAINEARRAEEPELVEFDKYRERV